MLIAAIISILTGLYKEYIFILVLIIIHELGHFLCAKAFGIKTSKILIYPLGGISKMEMDINENYKRELLIIGMGPVFQIIAYEILIVFFWKEKELIQQIHFGILSFNLLPIYPLDGGKIMNILLNFSLPYRKAFHFSLILSYILTIIILFLHPKFSLNSIIMYCVLMCLIYKEELKGKIYFQKFLLERIIKKHTYKKSIIINDIKDMYRYKYNFLKKDNKIIKESDFLIQKYDKFSKNY